MVFAHRAAPQTTHDPGRVLADLAVVIADGGEAISDIATLADQAAVFGPVASDSTCWRVLNSIGAADLAAVAQARAAARQMAWAQRAEVTGQALPVSRVAGTPLLDAQGRPVLVIDEDATIVVTHSEKEHTAPTFCAAVAELTGALPAATFADYPPGMRVIVRRERPHPGAQLDLYEERDGWRYPCFATDTRTGQHAWLDARHRSHARVEDRIRCGKDAGLGRFPSRLFAINAAWLSCALTAIDLIAWAQTILLHDQPELARAEPKKLRYLLHVAARIVRGGRKLRLKIDRNWRWAPALAAAFHRLRALPVPAT